MEVYMNSKQFLEQALVIVETIQACTASIKNYDELAGGTGAIRYDRDGSQTQRSANAPFELPMCEKRDLEEMEKKERAELWEKLKEIRYVVKQVEDQNVQNVLRMRFIAHKTRDEIAEEYKISTKTVDRRLEDGYHEVSLITGYPEPPKRRMPARPRHPIARQMMKEVYGDE